MKYFKLILSNFRRKKMRTVLTIGSFMVAMSLFGVLAIIHEAFYGFIQVAGVDRLVVISKVSLIQPLPQSYQARLERIPGIKRVTGFSWFGGVYKEEKNFFPQFSIDAERVRPIYPEFQISDDQWQAFLGDRQGCVIGKATADRFEFKVGDRIPIRGTIFQGQTPWEFNVRGIYTGARKSDDTSQFWFHRKYLEENGPSFWHGLMGWYVVQVEDPNRAAELVKQIDDQFANSTWETRTQTEREFAAGFVKQMGNIRFLIMTIGTVVLFTLLIVSANTMAMAIRERAGELAVLKTVGFRDGHVLTFVLVESVLVAGVGGGLGLFLAWFSTLGGSPVPNILPVWSLPTASALYGVAVTLGVGLLAGLLPAIGAMRLRVVAALRRV